MNDGAGVRAASWADQVISFQYHINIISIWYDGLSIWYDGLRFTVTPIKFWRIADFPYILFWLESWPISYVFLSVHRLYSGQRWKHILISQDSSQNSKISNLELYRSNTPYFHVLNLNSIGNDISGCRKQLARSGVGGGPAQTPRPLLGHQGQAAQGHPALRPPRWVQKSTKWFFMKIKYFCLSLLMLFVSRTRWPHSTATSS